MFEWEPHILTINNSPGEEELLKQFAEFWDETIGPYATYMVYIEDKEYTWKMADGSPLTKRVSHLEFYSDTPLNLQFFVMFFDKYGYSYIDVDFCSHKYRNKKKKI